MQDLWKSKDSLGVAFLFVRGAVGAASHGEGDAFEVEWDLCG